MKFKGSELEVCFNEYWNQTVVTLDDRIRNISLGFGFFEKIDTDKLIYGYYQNVMNLLSNINRQTTHFEDNEYILAYRQNTIAQATEDLEFYRDLFPEYYIQISDLINNLNSKANAFLSRIF